jgi:hypothetical protein
MDASLKHPIPKALSGVERLPHLYDYVWTLCFDW